MLNEVAIIKIIIISNWQKASVYSGEVFEKVEMIHLPSPQKFGECELQGVSKPVKYSPESHAATPEYQQ